MGGGGLVALVSAVYPSPGTQVVFLVLFFAASFGGLNLALRSAYAWYLPEGIRRRDPQRPTREAFLLAIFATTCAGLQMLRLLTLTNGLLLLGILGLVEIYWLSRMRR
jgi:hypothetical protein